MKRWKTLALAAGALTALTGTALPFCGFYVAKADTKLFNKASKVVITHEGDRTVMTMSSDYEGDPKEFAIVIPVPTFLEKDQIHITEMKYVDHLDAYTAPRLVEYFDEDPCRRAMAQRLAELESSMKSLSSSVGMAIRANALGVKIEASYTIGEYDILILSAKESTGLETWLRESGYKIPDGATQILGSYLGQNMKFFVAKVNLEEKAKLGFTYLRPIQVAYESPKFMLPVRLGTINANGPQELFAFILSKNGRVEPVNYRTVRVPTDVELPPYIKEEFGPFYKAMFEQQTKKEDMRVVFLEYAWDMGWCDPCAADPLSNDELLELGAHWVDAPEQPSPNQTNPNIRPMPRRPQPGSPQSVFVTRLHFKYTKDTFPEDLRFQETADRQNFQGRYILRHPFKGSLNCPEAEGYRAMVAKRSEEQVKNLLTLTGWDAAVAREKAGLSSGDADPKATPGEKKWYKKMWDRK